MKLLKKLAILCTALTLCIGVGAFTACGGDKDNTSSSTPPMSSNEENSSSETIAATGYTFKVVTADGTAPAVGEYSVQLCKGMEMCYTPMILDENGCVVYTGAPSEGVYDIHILINNPTDDDYDENGMPYAPFDGVTQTPAAYNTEAIVLTLK